VRELVIIERQGVVTVIHCSGDLDLATRDRLRAGLTQVRLADVEGVVVDLSRVTFMDCTALNVILMLARDCARAGAGFVLAGPPSIVRRLIETLELDEVLALADDPGDAVRRAAGLARLRPAGPDHPGDPLSRLLPRVPAQSRVPPAPGASPGPAPPLRGF
jgi:anti-anti-sigma factor